MSDTPRTPVEPGGDEDGIVLDDEIAGEMSEVAGLSQAQIVRRRFLRHKGAMISLAILVLIILLAATSVGWGPIPGWWKWGANDLVPRVDNDSPTLSFRPQWLGGAGVGLGEHPFGVDNELGKDMFAQTIRGVQTSLTVILVLGVLSTTIGVLIGALSGYYGGWVDSVLMRFTDVIIVLPLLVITAVAGFALDLKGIWAVAVALGIFTWTGLARLVRAEFLALREREFVDAARVANASNLRIIFKHILPNTVGTIVVSTTLLMGAGLFDRGGTRLPRLRHQPTRSVARLARQPVPGRLRDRDRGCSSGPDSSSWRSCSACSSSATDSATRSTRARSGSPVERTSTAVMPSVRPKRDPPQRISHARRADDIDDRRTAITP